MTIIDARELSEDQLQRVINRHPIQSLSVVDAYSVVLTCAHDVVLEAVSAGQISALLTQSLIPVEVVAALARTGFLRVGGRPPGQ